MDYAALLQGRPFQAPAYQNPYADIFQNFIQMAQAFQKQAPTLAKGGTLARPSEQQGQMAMGRDETQRPAAPQAQMFGGY